MVITPDAIAMRRRRAVASMRARGLDAILVTEKYNYWYLTGHLSREFDKKMRVLALVLSVDGVATIVLPENETAMARRTAPSDRFLSYVDVPFPPELIARALLDTATDAARIGIEAGTNERLGIAISQLDAVRSAAPKAQLEQFPAEVNRDSE